MRLFCTVGSQNAADKKTVLLVMGTAAHPTFYEVIFGSAAVPSDHTYHMQLVQMVPVGLPGLLGDSVESWAVNLSQASANMINSLSAPTPEPNYDLGKISLQWAQNAQATFRWVVPPTEGIRLADAAGLNVGMGLRFLTATGGTSLCQGCLYHME